MARPTKLTPEVQQKICDALKAGNYFETACEHAGIDRRTGYEWLERGEGRNKNRASNAEFAQFAHAVRLSETEAEMHAVETWKSAFGTDWRAAKDFLARRFPKRWQERKTLSVADLTDEQIISLLAEEADSGGES